MAKSFLLSERDHGRLQKLLRWFDKKVDTRFQRRRRHGGRGGTRIRKAFASVAAGASGTIACFLDTDGEGDTVDVVCEVADGETDLNSALPRLRDGDMIHVYNDSGVWRSIMTFQASGPC